MTVQPVQRAEPHGIQHLLIVLSVGMAVGSFFTLRYFGLWAEQDTGVFVRAIEGLIDAGTLTYPEAYSHGYAYPVWAATLAEFTGLPVSRLIATLLPIVSGILLGVTGYSAFSLMLGSRRRGMAAAGVLFLVPELVFTVMRGNHEKLTVSLTLLVATALLAGFLELRRARRWRVFAGWVVVQYLGAFTLVSVNSFFGSSFIVAITLCLVFALGLVGLGSRRSSQVAPVVRRLVIVSAASWTLVALVVFFIYAPAADVLRTMASANERLAALLLSAEPASDPYAVTARDWANQWMYHALSSFRWLLFLGSFTWWAWRLTTVVREPDRVPLNELYVIALYGALGLQLAVAVPVDFLGLDAGSNLQVRLFTYFSVIAAPMFVSGVAAAIASRQGRGVPQRALGVALTLSVLFGMASLAKSTLEPAISNRWLFYRPAEVEAMRFWDERHEWQTLWTDPEGRLTYAYVMEYGRRATNSNTFDAWTVDSRSTHAVRSEVIAASAVVWRLPPSILWTENRAYDNGGVQVFHRIPRTPFQR